MPDARDMIIFNLVSAQKLLHRYTDDLKPEEYLSRVHPTSNCAAWMIGHLILTERGILKQCGYTDQTLPPLPEGFEKRFARDEAAPKANDFGDVTQLLPLFDQHREQLIGFTRSASDEQLAKLIFPEKPRPIFKTFAEAIDFMAIHVILHTGQITMIRRSLGRPIIA